MIELFKPKDFGCIIEEEAPLICDSANNKIQPLIDCLKYYAQKNGKNSKAAVLLREMGLDV